MSTYLIQDNAMSLMADHMRRLSGTTDSLNGAEIAEIFSRTQGNVKNNGEYNVKALSYYGSTLKSGTYDTGEVFAFPKPLNHQIYRFSKWTANVPITDNFVVVGESPVNVSEIMEPIDKDNIVICFNITSNNTIVSPYIQYYMKGTINWGDGTIETYDTASRISHTYVNTGVYFASFSIENKTAPAFNSSLVYGVEDGEVTQKAIQAICVPFWCTSIYNGFQGLTNLEYVFFADGACISENTNTNQIFYNCQSLKHIALPPSMKRLCEMMFNSNMNGYDDRYCGISSIILPYGVEIIPYGCFIGCKNLSEVLLPDTVTSIDAWAFGGCSNLSNIYIPNSVASIGSSAFKESGVTSINIPEGITSIPYGAFAECNKLSNISIPNSVTSIGGGYAFGFQESDVIAEHLTLILPSVTSIQEEAFRHRGNHSTRSLTLVLQSESVCTLGKHQTWNKYCQYLNIYVPDALVSSYKAAENWNNVAHCIKPLSEYTGNI